MPLSKSHNDLDIYETALRKLRKDPDSRAVQHEAVLAMARAGALDFARTEYRRYGLDKVTDNEDIMSLGGRLLKDAALRESGDARRALARESAALYSNAFKATGGYYSAINAATMALLAGESEDTIRAQAKAIFELLPDTAKLDKSDIYYAKATRAEAELLSGDYRVAAQYLRSGVAHDPLNFTAHASTLRQFRMILRAREENTDWLSAFTPPKAMHFSGHMFALSANNGKHALDTHEQESLRVEISDAIQRSDIGFGYGALAAGSDIMIAETLLEEGAELHVVLPVDPAEFQAISVAPFGDDWVGRFETCMKAAHSLTLCDSGSDWPHGETAPYANHIAMGLACMKAERLSTTAAQLLIWDGLVPEHRIGTAQDAARWAETQREQIIIPYPKARPSKPASRQIQGRLKVAVTVASEHGHEQFSDPAEAARMALSKLASATTPLSLGAHYGPIEPDNNSPHDASAKDAQARALPGTVYICEPFAAVLSAFHSQEFEVEFVGLSESGLRLFNLQARGQAAE